MALAFFNANALSRLGYKKKTENPSILKAAATTLLKKNKKIKNKKNKKKKEKKGKRKEKCVQGKTTSSPTLLRRLSWACGPKRSLLCNQAHKGSSKKKKNQMINGPYA